MSTKLTTGSEKLFGQIHQPHGFAIALRARHAEIVLQALLRGAAFLVTEHDDRAAEEFAGAAEDGGVFAVIAVAREFDEIGDQRGDVIAEARPILVARDLRLLPGIELGVDVGELVLGLGLQPREFDALRNRVRARGLGQSRSSSILVSISATDFSKSR